MASVLFAERGYGASSTAEIAAAAGVSQGTLFHHFPTKRALLTEVGAREGDRVLAVALAVVDAGAPPPSAETFLRPLFAYARRQPDAYRLFAMDGDVEDLASGFSAKRERVTAGLSALIAAWQTRGQLRSVRPELVADLVFAVVDTAVRRLVLEDRWHEEDEWLREAASAVDGILSALPSPSAHG